MNKCKCEKTSESMRMDISCYASRQWMRLTCKSLQLPESWAAHTALQCVGLQDSRLGRQWSEAVFGRWPWVMHKKCWCSHPSLLPSGSWMSDLSRACTRSLKPCWCSFPLCRVQITHCIYWLTLTSTFYFSRSCLSAFVSNIFRAIMNRDDATAKRDVTTSSLIQVYRTKVEPCSYNL